MRYFTLVGLLLASICNANPVETTDTIKNAIVTKLHQSYPKDEKLTFDVGHIDSRLNLSQCQQPLAIKLPTSQQGHRLLATVSCSGERPWKIHVPVTISRLQYVVVANQNLMAGTTLSEVELALQERNIAEVNQSYIADLADVTGMELKRSVKIGTIINKTMLKYPLYVKRGDVVQVIVQKGQFKVQTPGIAQKSGTLYEDIPVKNMSSKKVVVAEVVRKGLTKVTM